MLKCLLTDFWVSILVILEIQSDHQTNDQTNELKKERFNPCYLGNTIRSFPAIVGVEVSIEFQSLLSWKYNQICIPSTMNVILAEKVSILVILEIQSDRQAQWINAFWDRVSILVILEIQSDLFSDKIAKISCNTSFQSLLSWKYNQIESKSDQRLNWYTRFNPCYLGNTIRSKPRFIFIFFIILSFNPCYLGNTIRSSLHQRYTVVCFNLFQSLLSWKYNQI